MNSATKAALYNALLLPGWGHLYLKKYKRGFLLITAMTAGTLYILWSVIQTTISLLKISPFKKGTVSFEAVVQFAIKSVQDQNFFYFYLLLLFMIILWILSIIDAYAIGKKEMVKATAATE
jgi:TM2 domain-containing membrane protein YozV